MLILLLAAFSLNASADGGCPAGYRLLVANLESGCARIEDSCRYGETQRLQEVASAEAEAKLRAASASRGVVQTLERSSEEKRKIYAVIGSENYRDCRLNGPYHDYKEGWDGQFVNGNRSGRWTHRTVGPGPSRIVAVEDYASGEPYFNAGDKIRASELGHQVFLKQVSKDSAFENSFIQVTDVSNRYDGHLEKRETIFTRDGTRTVERFASDTRLRALCQYNTNGYESFAYFDSSPTAPTRGNLVYRRTFSKWVDDAERTLVSEDLYNPITKRKVATRLKFENPPDGHTSEEITGYSLAKESNENSTESKELRRTRANESAARELFRADMPRSWNPDYERDCGYDENAGSRLISTLSVVVQQPEPAPGKKTP